MPGAAMQGSVFGAISSIVNTRKQGSAQDVGADNEPSAASRAAYQDPTAVPLPEEKDCAKIGTVAILGVTGLWQLRTLYLTEDVLWVGHRDTARCLDNFWLVNIRKIKSLDAQDDHDDGMGETMVPDESACCFSLYVKCASTGEEPHLELELDAEDDKHDVKIMCIRTLSSEERDQWMSSLEESVEKAKAAELARRPPPTCQQRLSDLYNSHICQGLVMTLVITNFSISLAEAEIVPDEGSSLHKTLEDVDIMFTALFAIELAVNMAAHWFWEFWSSSWNWLDFLVVIVSLGSIGTDAGPTIKVIRILRALRVMRLVKRLIALRMIVAAIASSVFPVANVFFLLMLVTIVYAILGVGLFKESSEEFFGNLSRGFFTMFQCVTGDGWASSIARPMMEIADPVGGYDAATAIFFLSYIIIVSWIIVNVVLAVLLDEFLKSSAVEKANITAEQQTFEDLAEIRGPLDPLMRNLSVFRNSDDLYSRISSVFASFEGETVCCDPEHRVKLESVCRGLRALRLSPRLDVSKETILEMWHTFTNGSVSHFGFEHSVKHENPSTAIVRKQGINGMEFEKLMLWQLGKYIERCASKALETADGEPLDPAAATTLLMLKFILAQVGNNVIKDFGNHSSPGPSRKDADEERESGAIYVQASHLLGPGASKRETMTRKNNISFGSNVGLEQKVDVLVSQQAEMLETLAVLMRERRDGAENEREKERRSRFLKSPLPPLAVSTSLLSKASPTGDDRGADGGSFGWRASFGVQRIMNAITGGESENDHQVDAIEQTISHSPVPNSVKNGDGSSWFGQQQMGSQGRMDWRDNGTALEEGGRAMWLDMQAHEEQAQSDSPSKKWTSPRPGGSKRSSSSRNKARSLRTADKRPKGSSGDEERTQASGSDPDQETEEWETRSKEEQNVLEEARRRLEARFGVGRQGSRGRKFSHEDSPIYNGEDNQV